MPIGVENFSKKSVKKARLSTRDRPDDGDDLALLYLERDALHREEYLFLVLVLASLADLERTFGFLFFCNVSLLPVFFCLLVIICFSLCVFLFVKHLALGNWIEPSKIYAIKGDATVSIRRRFDVVRLNF